MLPDPMMPGIYPGIPDAEYRKAPGVSQSALKSMALSFAHYLDDLAHPTKPTPAMINSRICHTLLLSPNEPQDWIVKPKYHDGRTKEGKAWLAENGEKGNPIDFEAFQNIQNAVAAAKAHPFISLALDGAECELSIWSYQNTSAGRILKKGRLDIAPSGPAICDAKFVENATESSFASMVADFRYYMQAPYYIDLYNENLPPGEEEKTRFCFFVIEKHPPYAIRVFNLDERDIARGRAEYQRYLEIFAECDARKETTPYHAGSAFSLQIKDLQLPAYARKRLDDQFIL